LCWTAEERRDLENCIGELAGWQLGVSIMKKGSGDDVPLTRDHETILRTFLKKTGKFRLVVDVAADGPIRNRGTVGKLLRELVGFGLLQQRSRRTGFAVTEAGARRLNDISST
jgi:hypothetical protein